MKKLLVLLFMISIITNCKKSENDIENKTIEKQVVTKKDEPSEKEKVIKPELNQDLCHFSNPDTSVVGIKISNVESTLDILGEKTSLRGDTTHYFYSNDKKQQLGLTVHPGSYRSQVSIFKISYSENSNENNKLLNFTEFKTEQGIKLGLSKNEIIKKLGNCYTTKDSSKNSIELNYRIEQPNDSKTKLLYNNNMPIYYASYKFKNNKLKNIEFGFEYP